MGLLDSLFAGNSGGGLLDFLRNNAMNQQFSSGMPSDQAQYGSAPSNAFAQLQPNPSMMGVPQQPPPVIQAQPAQAPVQQPQMQQPQQAQMPDLGGGGLSGLARPGSIMGALLGAPNPANQTAKALLAKGVDLPTVQAAINNPELMNTLIKQTYGPQTIQSIGDGYIVDKNGKVTRAYTPEQKDNFAIVQTGEDGLGRKTFAKMNKATGEQSPIEGAPSTSAGGIGDMNKSGAEYFSTLPKQVQGTVSGMLDGTIQPPSSFAAAKPYWQGMLAAAKNVDPGFDETKWASRHTMANQLALSGNSTMGGILSNGESSFKHLAEYTKSAADQGNASHNFPLGGVIAHAQNYAGNAMGGSDVLGKVKAINDNLGHYGQESTKFYAGTGGGVEERMNALKEMNPLSTSSEEAAAYAEKEKGLMLDRLNTKLQEIRNVYGEEQGNKIIAQHMPEIQQNIATIDANVAKLRGNTPQAQSPDRSAIEAEMRRRGLLK